MANLNVPGSAKGNGSANGARTERMARSRLRTQTREATRDFEAIGGIAKDAREKLGQRSASATGYYEQGEEKVRQVRRTLERFIRDEPVKTVLIAAGVGLLFGRFWMRR